VFETELKLREPQSVVSGFVATSEGHPWPRIGDPDVSRSPYFKFYVNDYEGDTLGATLVERGVYTQLLAFYWRTQGPIPDDEAFLRRVCAVNPKSNVEKRAVQTVCDRYFVKENGRLSNRRMDEEIRVRNAKRDSKVCSHPEVTSLESRKPRPKSESESEKTYSVDVVKAVEINDLNRVGRESDTRAFALASPPALELVSPAKKKRSRSEVDPAFQPPTLEEITQFVNTKRIPIDAYQFYAHYENTNWRYGRPPGYPIRNWHMLAYKWGRKEQGRAN
jgi:uncharacterized protein YdaU (DUF1376 family)